MGADSKVVVLGDLVWFEVIAYLWGYLIRWLDYFFLYGSHY